VGIVDVVVKAGWIELGNEAEGSKVVVEALSEFPMFPSRFLFGRLTLVDAKYSLMVLP